ncbi:MAG: XrtA system polysaccharide deacetylase [Gemmataceae bacterium]
MTDSSEHAALNDPPGSSFIVSFDIEEHHRIEAAAQLTVSDDLKRTYAWRMEAATRRILDLLYNARAQATFYIVGEIAVSHPKLVRDIAEAGHEVGSHSWDHRRVHRFNEASFREDLLKSKDALEQATGKPVLGFRAPTFSIMRETHWALDVLAECGFEYDSSIFPVRHDRYGVPQAPRSPFLAKGQRQTILELPPATFKLFGPNLPVAGGGYFRLFPLAIMEAGIRQLSRKTKPPVAMLYFHPWEFDTQQPKLPLGRASRFRTYVGIRKSVPRLRKLLSQHHYRRAIDVVREIRNSNVELKTFAIGE